MKSCAVDCDYFAVASPVISDHNPIVKVFIFAEFVSNIGQASDLLSNLVNMNVCGSGAGF